MLYISLDLSILETQTSQTTTDQTLNIKDSVKGVYGDLVLSGITDETCYEFSYLAFWL